MKSVVITFGRFNPITSGHERLFNTAQSIAKSNGSEFLIIPTETVKPKDKNPLSSKDKRRYLRMMGYTNLPIAPMKTFPDAIESLYKSGYRDITLVIGSDRLVDFERIGKTMAQVLEGLEFRAVSPAELTRGYGNAVSATLMRKAVADGDFKRFLSLAPSFFQQKLKYAREYYMDIRSALGFERIIESKTADDPDLKGHQPKKYFSGLDKKEKESRQRHFDKKRKMSDDNPDAYKPAPGDTDAKTKPSKHTKKFDQMFGESHWSDGCDVIAESYEKMIRNKAKKTGISYNILKQVADRGMAAWKTGHRPGTTPHQWAAARINSFATGGKTQKTADKDLWAKVSSGAKDKLQGKSREDLNEHWSDSIDESMDIDQRLRRMTKRRGEPVSKYLDERELTKDEQKSKEKYITKLKDTDSIKKDFKDRYGDDWESVMYGTATNMAKRQGKGLDEETLDQPQRTPKGDSKKYEVDVENPKTGNVNTVKFGDPNMEIRRDNPEARKNFRSRHNCDEKTDKTTPGFWACKFWEKGKTVSDLLDN